MEEQVAFEVGNAFDTQFEAGTFDLVLLQHVAMNIEDRVALYAETPASFPLAAGWRPTMSFSNHASRAARTSLEMRAWAGRGGS